MRLLLSCFEPFGGQRVNPSRRVMDTLAPHIPVQVGWCGVELPVARDLAFAHLRSAWCAGLPQDGAPFDVWLGLGQAGGRPVVCAEQRAVNLFRGTVLDPDAAASSGTLEPGTSSCAGPGELVPGASTSVLCRWPAARLVSELVAEGGAAYPLALSDSAGTFVCNEVLYRMEHLQRTPEARTPVPASALAAVCWAGFLHLPYLPEQVAVAPRAEAPALALDIQVGVVSRVIRWLSDARSTAPEQAQA